MEIRRAAMIGLGSIGSYLAPGLEKALGHENFMVIAGGIRKKRLETEGTTINGVTYRFQVVDPEEAHEPVDLVMMIVKGPQMEEAVRQLGCVVGENTILLSLMNGISSEEALAEVYGWDRVIYGVTRVSIRMVDHKVEYDPSLGLISFGEARNELPYTPRIQAVADLFERAGIPYRVPEDMKRDMWLKYCANLAENLPSAIIGNCYGAWKLSGHARELYRMVYGEAAKVACACGVEITEKDLERQWKSVFGAPFYNVPSTRQDIEQKRKTEVDLLAGNLIRLGEKHGIETPYCRWMYHAICLLEEMNEGKICPQEEQDKE